MEENYPKMVESLKEKEELIKSSMKELQKIKEGSLKELEYKENELKEREK